MSDRQQDPELRARFQEQKRDDASQAPSFATVMARVKEELAHDADSTTVRDQRVRWRRYGLTGALAAAAAIAALIVIPRANGGDDAFEQAVRAFQTDPALGAWRSPTDGLLQLPGNQLMTSIPRVGTGQQ